MKKSIIFAATFMLLLASSTKAQSCKSCDHKVKNLIVLVGDGMGLAHLSYTDHLYDKPMFVERVKSMGLVRTFSASNKVTDSAASATAYACGVKTINGMLGMGVDSLPVKSILERAEENGLATGLVATYAITHATPAGYIAHNPSRGDGEGIAEDFLKTDIDVFIGGGRDHFEKRADGRNLSQDLKSKGYNVVYDIDDVVEHKDGKLAAMLAGNGLPTMLEGRGDMLPTSTDKALECLSKMSDKGFFVMIEGSQIDGQAHKNNAEGVVAETIDFDKSVQKAFDFADKNPGTLVVVFADHETGGITMPADGKDLKAAFGTKSHTGIMVPIYAYGACANAFTGVMDNTEIPKRMAKVLGIEW